jgi:transposase
MAKPYSYDLRQKVIQAIKLDGLNKSEASQLFNISRNTIDLWLKRFSETGFLQEVYSIAEGRRHRAQGRRQKAEAKKIKGFNN